MEYIRVTKDNIEKEHICCAISNNNDVQVASKKAWLSERFDDGLVFLKRNALLNISLPKMRGIRLKQTVICLLTASGFRGHSKDTVIQTIYSANALPTVKAREKRAYVFSHPQRKSRSLPTRNI